MPRCESHLFLGAVVFGAAVLFATVTRRSASPNDMIAHAGVDATSSESADRTLRGRTVNFTFHRDGPRRIRPSSGRSAVPIAYYYKCTLKSDRCKITAGRFTGDPEQLVLLFDAPADANLTAARADLAVRAPAARVVFDAATNDFGFYKKFGYYSVEHKTRGLWAQRRKTRAVFEHFFEQRNGTALWVCYLDADMVVNATMLVAELTQRLPRCRNDCWVGTVTHWKDYAFTAGGWCMDGGLARRVYDLLNRVNDTELFGKRNLADDVGVGWLMRQRFGVDPTDSIGWHTQMHDFCATASGLRKFRFQTERNEMGCDPKCKGIGAPSPCQDKSVYHEPCRVHQACIETSPLHPL